jgi:hypothetical protein
MLTKKLRFSKWLALSAPLCFATYVGAQSTPGQNTTRDNDIDVSRSVPDRDINHGDLSRFDRFLDDHREIAEQLRRDPSLANNKQFLKDHPALESYLRQNSDIRDALKDNPNAFMSAEGRFDRKEAYRGELANFDRFLDAHRDIASEVRKDPALVENQQFLKDHPELQSYLQNHPEIRQQIDRNPNGFMQQESNYDRNEDSRNRNNDRGALASFDQFLDSHREIAEQLHKQPSQADNKQFLKDHPALQSYLQQHPEVREQLAQNPNAFMGQEARYERSADDRSMDRNASYDRDRNNNAYDRDRNEKYDRDRSGDDVRNRSNNSSDYDRDRSNGVGQHDRDIGQDRDAHRHFGEFLGSHQGIAEQLSKNPSLAKDHDYLQNHPELQEYLNAHPEVRKPLTSDPNTFMKSAQQFNSNGQGGQTGKMPAPTSTQPKPKQ